jgi:hypothetical protein
LLEEKIKVIWNTVQAACLKSLWNMGKSEFLAGRKGEQRHWQWGKMPLHFDIHNWFKGENEDMGSTFLQEV